ncbi:MAG: dihydrofolate reductase family protein, partial [Ilumatobacteraceae bacterium]
QGWLEHTVHHSTSFRSWWKYRTVQRLFPLPAGPTTIAEAYGVQRPQPESGRPWVGLCMVASIDGSTVLDGASAGLSSDVDRQVMLTLRSIADMIIVGAGTVRAEGYGPPRKTGQRIGVVTRTGKVDLHLPLFTSGAGFLIMADDSPELPVDTVRAGTGEIDLAVALTRLPGSPRFVQAEGGASLNGSLAASDLLDEINITTSPMVVGGAGSRATTHAPALSHRYSLAHLIADDNFLFSRYVRA